MVGQFQNRFHAGAGSAISLWAAAMTANAPSSSKWCTGMSTAV